jgi:DDE superfamily endonuclease/Tc5 transposase DNA-binding domain
MPRSYQEIEKRVQQALDHYERSSEPNLAHSASLFDVPYHRLHRRAKGIPSRITVGGYNKALTDDQEKALCQWIDQLDDLGFPLRAAALTSSANSLLRNAHDPTLPDPPRTVGPNWARRFLKRHPEYTCRKRKPLSKKRKDSHDPQDIREWYRRLENKIKEHGIQPQDIYNMDETGFRIGVGRAHSVITRYRSGRQYLADPDNRDYITSIECICADGTALPSCLVLKGAIIQERFIVDQLDESTLLATSETGYSNDMINIEWIAHFDEHTRLKTIGAFRLLILDGFTSHIEYEFIQFCNTKKIIPFTLPPHTSHLLQPLDVVVFQPLKHFHAEAIDQAVRTGDTTFSKIEFLAAFKGFHSEAFKRSTIISAFRATGIVPFCPAVVVNQMQEAIEARRQAQRLATPPPLNPFDNPTPTKVHEFYTLADAIRKGISYEPLPSFLQEHINRFIRGSLVQAQVGAQIKQALQETQAAEAARAARKRKPRRVVLQGGVITVRDARMTLKRKDEEELARQARQLEREKRIYLRFVQRAVARARERIRRLNLRAEYGQEI